MALAEVPAPSEPSDPKWDLRLYVTSRSPKSVRAIQNLGRLCDAHVPGQFRIEVIDLVENPRLALEDQILAVPTLVRKLSRPIRKFVGDMSDEDRLLVGLQIRLHHGSQP